MESATDQQTLADTDVPTRRLVPLEEVRFLLGGVSRATLYRRIADGSLLTCTWGGRRFCRSEDIDALVMGLGE
jgi:hypothetical protein